MEIEGLLRQGFALYPSATENRYFSECQRGHSVLIIIDAVEAQFNSDDGSHM